MATVDLTALGLKPFYSFAHLVVGPNNHVAAAACHAVAVSPGEAYNPLFIYGPAGVGKTHLLQAVAHEMLKNKPACKIKYISAERFMNEILAAISEDRVVEVRRLYSNLDLLIVDDVQYLTESKVSQEELFHIFNNLHQGNRQVILAADRPPNQLTNLNQNIRTRLEWGLASDVKIPDAKTRLEILKKKQNQQGLNLSEEMLLYVAQVLSSNVRELEGFLKRVHAYATLSHQQVTMELVESIVREILPEGRPVPAPDALAHPADPLTNGAHKPAPAKKSHAPPPEHEEPEAEEEEAPPPPPPKAAKVTPAPKAAPAPPPPPVPASEPELQIIGVPLDAGPPEPTPIPDLPEEEIDPNAELPSGHKEVGAVFFYPAGCKEALETVHRKFQDVIKKHKLKFRLKRVNSSEYVCKGKINYSSFVDVCKVNKVPVAIVVGPPPESLIPEQDFYDLLTVTLDVQGVSLQLVNWGEINKDYRYLNLALDIALVRTR